MNDKTNYFHIINSKEIFILDNRIEINWVEIFTYPLPIFGFILLATNSLLISFLFAFFTGIFYLFFRYTAWFFYSQLEINKHDRSVKIIKKRINHIRRVEKIDNEFNLKKIQFKKLERSGKVKFLLIYNVYKPIEIMIIKKETHKKIIEEELKKI